MPRKWSKEVVVAAILERHRGSEKLSSDYICHEEPSLYQAARRHFGGWNEAVTAAGIDYAMIQRRRPMRRWSKPLIAEMITHRINNGLSISGAVVNEEDHNLYEAARRHFGKNGWAKARIYANFPGTDPRPWQKWTAENIIKEIQKLHVVGVGLNTGSMAGNMELERLRTAGRRVFGSWKKTIYAAGINYARVRKIREKNWWTKDRITTTIRKLHRSGVDISSRAIRRTHGDLHASAFKLFNNWSSAIEAAGIDYEEIRRIRPPGWWTEERVIKAIHLLEKEGVRLSTKAMHATNIALYSAAVVRFGSWSQAVEGAGISYRQHCQTWSTKAWLRSMTEDEYNTALQRAMIHAKKRSNTR